jgi:hypothetical protein
MLKSQRMPLAVSLFSMHGSCLPYEELIYEIEKWSSEVEMLSKMLSEQKKKVQKKVQKKGSIVLRVN